MLDIDTKKKIDNARNILVGKVPDPKAQIDQITTALIYKFMDDMDREAESFGGNAKFLVGELEPFKWANLMDKSLGGSERLNLYMSALLEFAKSSHIPDIFRTIFKDAFLPYRDAETFNLFLKEIDYFDYSHSENLGNAFEYLLSILGSQGDAGQFRTPRHIIDFIVQILEPKKDETVLDPSCGTAGFLISAYKYIMANNKLSPDEKKRLMNNFTGYDISPDMVRLSLVNMYLHSFPSPKVYEYDTLTSEDRWNDSFDVILANPPFMTPKGGIRPHNRFSVQANRSEVLFVDYIAEHLSLNGRAGIIVPEGIIFQSANAYKALRKMLIENGFLWAVVSLPAGVFQPYSGVKTSILLLDRTIAKRSEDILFLKISNDGFDLGAQRREINKNDLPEALEVLRNYRMDCHGQSPRSDDSTVIANEVKQSIFHIVPKSKIAENGDYNLTGDRYKENSRVVQTAYPMVKLGDVCEILKGSSITKNQVTDGEVPVIAGRQQPAYFHNIPNRKGKIITVSASGAYAGYINYFEIPIFASDCSTIQSKNENQVKTNFVYLLLKNQQDEIYKLQRGMGQPHVYPKDLIELEIPFPPFEIQNQIVAQIEEWQKIIDGAKQVINSYHPTITTDPSWEMVKLGEVCEFSQGVQVDLELQSKEYFANSEKFLRIENYTQGSQDFRYIPKELGKNKYVSSKDVVVVRYGASAGFIGKGFDGILANNLFKVEPNTSLITKDFLYYLLVSSASQEYLKNSMGGGAMPALSFTIVKELNTFVPSLEIQNQIVEQIEKERQAVESCKSLVEMFEAKIKAKIDEVWGKATDE